MNIKTPFHSPLLAALLVVILTACSGTSEKKDANDERAKTETEVKKSTGPLFEVDELFQQQLAAVFTSYVSMKDAFVASDAAKVNEQSAKVKESLAKVDMGLVSGAAHNDWMTYLSPMETSINEIESSTDLETQRKSFSTFSDNLYKSIKAFGLGGKDAYYEFCPMAFNNEGGYWLSDKDEIRNPYFGDAMLTCGSVEEKLN